MADRSTETAPERHSGKTEGSETTEVAQHSRQIEEPRSYYNMILGHSVPVVHLTDESEGGRRWAVRESSRNRTFRHHSGSITSDDEDEDCVGVDGVSKSVKIPLPGAAKPHPTARRFPMSIPGSMDYTSLDSIESPRKKDSEQQKKSES